MGVGEGRGGGREEGKKWAGRLVCIALPARRSFPLLVYCKDLSFQESSVGIKLDF